MTGKIGPVDALGDATDPRARFGSVRFCSVRALTLAGTRKVSVGAGVRSVGRRGRAFGRSFGRSRRRRSRRRSRRRDARVDGKKTRRRRIGIHRFVNPSIHPSVHPSRRGRRGRFVGFVAGAGRRGVRRDGGTGVSHSSLVVVVVGRPVDRSTDRKEKATNAPDVRGYCRGF